MEPNWARSPDPGLNGLGDKTHSLGKSGAVFLMKTDRAYNNRKSQYGNDVIEKIPKVHSRLVCRAVIRTHEEVPQTGWVEQDTSCRCRGLETRIDFHIPMMLRRIGALRGMKGRKKKLSKRFLAPEKPYRSSQRFPRMVPFLRTPVP